MFTELIPHWKRVWKCASSWLSVSPGKVDSPWILILLSTLDKNPMDPSCNLEKVILKVAQRSGDANMIPTLVQYDSNISKNMDLWWIMDPYTFSKSNFFQSRFEIQGAMKCECQEAIAPVTFFFESPFVRDQILKAKPPTSVQPSSAGCLDLVFQNL